MITRIITEFVRIIKTPKSVINFSTSFYIDLNIYSTPTVCVMALLIRNCQYLDDFLFYSRFL